MTRPLDPVVHATVSALLDVARRNGFDEAEVLHNADLLLTPERDRQIRAQAMQYLVLQVQSWRPAEFLRRKFHDGHPATPKDMYNCILEFLEEHVSEWERNP